MGKEYVVADEVFLTKKAVADRARGLRAVSIRANLLVIGR